MVERSAAAGMLSLAWRALPGFTLWGWGMKAKVLSLCLLGLVAGGVAHAEESMPKVALEYQQGFQAAWDTSAKGELPVYECAFVAGVAAIHIEEKKEVEEARKAYKACYVDTAVRYSAAYFALRNNAEPGEDGKPLGCTMYARYINGHISALESYLKPFGFTASALNAEITQRLDAVSASCEVDLGA